MLAPAQIVVADSDPALSQFIIHVLERAGYAARTAPGPSAVDPAADADIVVLGGGAVAAATEGLRRRGLSAPVLVLTNGDDPAAKELAAADPRVRVLPKPFRPAALADAVATLLAGRQSGRHPDLPTEIPVASPQAQSDPELDPASDTWAFAPWPGVAFVRPLDE